MDIKQYEGKMSINDFVENIVSPKDGYNTLGDICERCVSCNNCSYYSVCRTIVDKLPEIKCSEVVDFLLGHKKVEEVKYDD